jgi:hypothetical protein
MQTYAAVDEREIAARMAHADYARLAAVHNQIITALLAAGVVATTTQAGLLLSAIRNRTIPFLRVEY